jgi:O-antigen biosynthesis protein WbqV
MVTGAGGTIGSEIVRQLARFGPSEIQLLDCGEFNLYSIDMELSENFPEIPRKPILCSIRQRESVMAAFKELRPELVFHAAALKHVPLVEENPCSGAQTNVIGTRNIADAARAHGTLAMVQVSSDKAVNPVGFMGATKRLGELYCQALDLIGYGDPDAPRFMTVRFGNVLGSSGSLIPLFRRQLSRGGPLTVTDPTIERYFMTVHEAVQLILHSSTQALQTRRDRGMIFVLDMGEPVNIMDLARRMIRLAGLTPDVDIKIEITGLRPGEKLFEELFDQSETHLPSDSAGIFRAIPVSVPLDVLEARFDELERAAKRGNGAKVRQLVHDLVNYRQDADQQPFIGRPAAAIQRTDRQRQRFEDLKAAGGAA